jgi:hypothetical protein
MINKRVQRNWRDLCAFQQLFGELFTLRPSLLLPVASFGKRHCETNGWLLKQSPKDQAQEMVGRLPEKTYKILLAKDERTSKCKIL